MAGTRKVLIGLTIGSIALCGLCGVGLFNGFGQPARGFEAELAKGIALGLPSDPAEYQQKIAPEENAASYYFEAFTAWETFKKSHKEIATRLQSGGLTDEYTAKQAREDFEQFHTVLSKLDEAATKPKLCFDKKYSDGVYALFPELAPLRTFTKIRALQAEVLGEEGNYAAAFKALSQGATISRQLGTDNQTMIHMLVQIAIHSIIDRSLERLLCDQGRTPNALQDAESVLAAFGPAPTFASAMRGEYAMTLGTLKLLDDPVKRAKLISSLQSNWDPDNESKGDSGLGGSFDWPALRYVMEANLVRHMREITVNAADKNASGTKLIALAQASDDRVSKANGPTNMLVSIMTPVYTQAAKSVVKVDAQERLLRILAASLSRPSGVKIPAGIDLDPFTDKAFARKLDGRSFKFWSVGPDGEDNGGLAIQPERSFQESDRNFDIVVGYPYVEKYRKEKTRPAPGP